MLTKLPTRLAVCAGTFMKYLLLLFPLLAQALPTFTPEGIIFQREDVATFDIPSGELTLNFMNITPNCGYYKVILRQQGGSNVFLADMPVHLPTTGFSPRGFWCY